MVAFGTACHMTAGYLGLAGFNGRHHLELRKAQMPCIGPPISWLMIPEDICNL